ncbi:MAG TPA: aminotransferase class V-fold PLP-dependent enzyme [Candidatus Acidoferrales bacterium]|nr:aminotransferase class V-fold PLP-dependent enzyme [Candidatus Acidoferrales bacterium]
MATHTDFRSEFFDFEDATYLAAAAHTPLPRAAFKALEAALELKRRPYLIEEPLYIEYPARVRGLLAQLLGTVPEEIGITTGASTGLVGIASAINWQPGDEILISRGEFPVQLCTWQPLAVARGVVLRFVKTRGRFPRAQDYLDALTPRTRLISASLVRFDDGSLLDAPVLAAGLASSPCRLLLDLSQICGAAPLDIRALGADFAVCAGYKWLLGPYGTGFVWARREHTEAMPPAPFYWMAACSERGFHDLDFDPDPAGNFSWRSPSGAARWDAAETASFFHLAAFAASLEFVLRAGPGTVLEHNRTLLGALVDRLPADRCVLASPQDPAQRGPYLCISARSPEATAQLYNRLREQKIYVSLRNNALRVAPYLYNTAEDIERLIRAITI